MLFLTVGIIAGIQTGLNSTYYLSLHYANGINKFVFVTVLFCKLQRYNTHTDPHRNVWNTI